MNENIKHLKSSFKSTGPLPACRLVLAFLPLRGLPLVSSHGVDVRELDGLPSELVMSARILSVLNSHSFKLEVDELCFLLEK